MICSHFQHAEFVPVTITSRHPGPSGGLSRAGLSFARLTQTCPASWLMFQPSSLPAQRPWVGVRLASWSVYVCVYIGHGPAVPVWSQASRVSLCSLSNCAGLTLSAGRLTVVQVCPSDMPNVTTLGPPKVCQASSAGHCRQRCV